MSKHRQFRISQIRDYPLGSRRSKVQVNDFSKPLAEDAISTFSNSLPRLLAASRLRQLVECIQEARRKKRSIIWGFGGHVIKVGLTPILVDLIDRGFVSALATNGSGIIHDFEIAFCGQTSEEVGEGLQTGSFGMARETAEFLNEAVNTGAAQGKGIGESVGHFMQKTSLEYPELSLFLRAYQKNLPCTVHVTIGADVIHNHPSASGEAFGKGSQIDFGVFTQQVSLLHDGGVFLNLGSAVTIPEVFLKAVSTIRNSGTPIEKFTTANLDFIQHYRPTKNVIERPVLKSGAGIALTGHHEIMVPLLAALLIYT